MAPCRESERLLKLRMLTVFKKQLKSKILSKVLLIKFDHHQLFGTELLTSSCLCDAFVMTTTREDVITSSLLQLVLQLLHLQCVTSLRVTRKKTSLIMIDEFFNFQLFVFKN